MEHPRYTNEELANMLLIYGECRKNGRQAAILYAERFPEKRHPAHGYFHNLLTRLVQHGTLHASTRALNHHNRPEEIINQVREAVTENPHTSTRGIGYDLGMDHNKAHRIIKKDLRMHPYKRHTTQMLLPQDLLRRERFCDWVSEQIYDIDDIEDDYFLRSILWTDESTFRSDGMINRHNEHHYAVENPHCIKETHVQGRFHVNVWMGIVDDTIIGPYFFPENVNVTAEVYSEFLEETLPGLLEDVPLHIRPNIIFQQDGHPAHTSLLARTILNRRFTNRWIGIHSDLHEWPPRSPDLTPLDFFAWGFIRDQVYKTLPMNRNELIERIRVASRDITPVTLSRVRQNFMRRVALCLENNGGHVEHVL
ncbi:uncharacterized protein [Temnothorax nylanderi]|uniref:uncharacterized protein n=1 Tax=Temnothorax nylanderi TaxID=102681 RepID=UPI003A846BE1